MPKLNVIKAINSVKVNREYDLRIEHMNTIRDYSIDACVMGINLFKFGYAQGVKAERAAQRKER